MSLWFRCICWTAAAQLDSELQLNGWIRVQQSSLCFSRKFKLKVWRFCFSTNYWLNSAAAATTWLFFSISHWIRKLPITNQQLVGCFNEDGGQLQWQCKENINSWLRRKKILFTFRRKRKREEDATMSKSNYITTWVPTSTVYMILYARLTDEMTTWQCTLLLSIGSPVSSGQRMPFLRIN